MKKILAVAAILFPFLGVAQNFGDFPVIEKEKLLRDIELLYQALDKYHSGMYWYTSKDSFDVAYDNTRNQITRDMNILEFHKLISPLVGLTREDHTDISLPDDVKEKIDSTAMLLPLSVVFLGDKLYCVKNGSDRNLNIEGKEIERINGQTPEEIVLQTGTLFASDGYIKPVKYSDMEGLSFSRYYYYYFGNIDTFQVQFKESEAVLQLAALTLDQIRANLKKKYPAKNGKKKEELEFRLLTDSIGYLGVHSFSNSDISKSAMHNNYRDLLNTSFKTIHDKQLSTLIIDVSQNGGGTEGNEGVLYSYLGDNYRKYLKVRAKAQKAILDNGVDEPIVLKTFGFWERVFENRKMPDGGYERKKNAGYGLMAYQKEPSYKFTGKVYVIISPVTYSGGSEFSNMMYTRKRATFVGQETGGGFYGNTSGYSRELTLPHSKITIDIPALQFVMNVNGLPFGRGVIPDHPVIPEFNDYVNGESTALKYILDLENDKRRRSNSE